MVDLLDVKDESIVGNAALCIGSCAEASKQFPRFFLYHLPDCWLCFRLETICAILADTSVVPRLLHHAKEAFGVVQQNCAVALAKLASGDDRSVIECNVVWGRRD